MTYTIKQFRSKRGCLSYILFDEQSKEAIIIDPSEEVPTDEYLKYINDNNLKVKYIFETHTHADHISSSKELKEKTKAKIVMHKNSPSKRKDIEVDDDYFIELGNTKIKIMHTPGHTNESISLYVNGAVFTGDALLIEGTGRTDFQLGDSIDLHNTLWGKLMILPDDTKVYPAHDYKNREYSTIKHEKENNPRLQLSKEEFIKTMDSHHPEKPELFDQAIEKNSQ